MRARSRRIDSVRATEISLKVADIWFLVDCGDDQASRGGSLKGNDGTCSAAVSSSDVFGDKSPKTVTAGLQVP
jgi:hypothetical protein